MIDETLMKALEEIFNSIKIKYNKGGQLSVNEWDITEEDTSIIDVVNFDEYVFTVNAIFERNDFKRARKGDFFNDLKQRFVLEERNVYKTEKKRVRLEMKLRQAIMTC